MWPVVKCLEIVNNSILSYQVILSTILNELFSNCVYFVALVFKNVSKNYFMNTIGHDLGPTVCKG